MSSTAHVYHPTFIEEVNISNCRERLSEGLAQRNF